MILPPGAGIGRLVDEVVAEIEAKAVAALGKDQEVPPALGAEHHQVLRPVGDAVHQHAADQVVRRIGQDLQRELAPHLGIAAVGADHQPRPPLRRHAVAAKGNHGRRTGRHVDALDAAQDGGAGRLGRGRQGRAHRRVAQAQRTRHPGDEDREVETEGMRLLARQVLVVGDDPFGKDAAGCGEGVEQAKALQLGDAPGRHELAAHPVDRHRVAFEDGNGDTAARQHRGQRAAGDASTDDDDVVGPGHDAPNQRSRPSACTATASATTGVSRTSRWTWPKTLPTGASNVSASHLPKRQSRWTPPGPARRAEARQR